MLLYPYNIKTILCTKFELNIVKFFFAKSRTSVRYLYNLSSYSITYLLFCSYETIVEDTTPALST